MLRLAGRTVSVASPRVLALAPDVPSTVEYRPIPGGHGAVAGTDDSAEALQMGCGWDTVEEVDDSLCEPLRELIRAAKAELDALL
ncbi:MAG TPA: hypothetical protein VM537_35155 [Anaerolineae bacterium]|nr:hypothetical protein [Anaerolineae bacterium]